MKASPLLLAAVCVAALTSAASAHPGHSAPASAPACYVAFWKGLLPKSGTLKGPEAGTAGIWSKAFVSKYRIVGMGLPDLAP